MIGADVEVRTGPALVFGVGELLCALPLADVVETIRPLPVQPLTDPAGMLLGVSVIRGEAVPVVDTARLIGAGEVVPRRFVMTRTERGPLAYAAGDIIGVQQAEPTSAGPDPDGIVAAVGVLGTKPLLFLRTTGTWNRRERTGRHTVAEHGEAAAPDTASHAAEAHGTAAHDAYAERSGVA